MTHLSPNKGVCGFVTIQKKNKKMWRVLLVSDKDNLRVEEMDMKGDSRSLQS